MNDFLAAAVPGAIGLAIGYVFGLLRDLQRVKSERIAKHQDQALEAAAGLLLTVEQANRAAVIAAEKGRAMAQAQDMYAPGKLDLMDSRRTASADYQSALVALGESVGATETHALRISILAPSIGWLVAELVRAASDLRSGGTGETSKLLQSEYRESRTEFLAKVQVYLQVPTKRRRPLLGVSHG